MSSKASTEAIDVVRLPKRRKRESGGRLGSDEVLLLWRALLRFRSGRQPPCAPRATPSDSDCPLAASCPRWNVQPDDHELTLEEDFDATERRQALWPCTRLMNLLDPDVDWIGRRR